MNRESSIVNVIQARRSASLIQKIVFKESPGDAVLSQEGCKQSTTKYDLHKYSTKTKVGIAHRLFQDDVRNQAMPTSDLRNKTLHLGL